MANLRFRTTTAGKLKRYAIQAVDSHEGFIKTHIDPLCVCVCVGVTRANVCVPACHRVSYRKSVPRGVNHVPVGAPVQTGPQQVHH